MLHLGMRFKILVFVASLAYFVPPAISQEESAELDRSYSFSGIQKLKDSISALQIERKVMAAQLGAEHPNVKSIELRIEATQNQLDAMSKRPELSFYMGLVQSKPSPMDMRKQFSKIAKVLRNTSDNDTREKARQALKAIISYQLDQDASKAKAQIAAAEKKLAELRKQLESRVANQEKVADTLVVLIENPQVGNGIPAEWLRSIFPVGSNSNAGDPFAASNNDDPFGSGNNNRSNDPFGSSDDPFGGPAGPSDDPFGGPGDGDPFGGPSNPNDPFGSAGIGAADPFGGNSQKPTKKSATGATSPQPAPSSNPFAAPSPAYEIEMGGRTIAVYETYDKGVPILTRQVLSFEEGKSQSVNVKDSSSIWMTRKGIIDIRPPSDEDPESVELVAKQPGKTQIAIHQLDRSVVRLNIVVTPASDAADLKPTLQSSDK